MEYHVLPGRSVVTDKSYLPGESVELSEKEGKRLIKSGVVKKIAITAATAEAIIAKIKVAKTFAELDELGKGEKRKTVVAALEAKRSELA